MRFKIKGNLNLVFLFQKRTHIFKSPSPRDLTIGFNYRFNYRFNYKLVDKFAYRLSCRLSYWNVPGQPFGRRLQKARFLYKILLKFVRFRSFVWGGPSDKPAYSVLLCGCAVPCVRRWLFTWTALLRVCACVLHWNVQHMRVGNVRVQHQESFTGWVRMEQARVS